MREKNRIFTPKNERETISQPFPIFSSFFSIARDQKFFLEIAKIERGFTIFETNYFQSHFFILDRKRRNQ